ncbi:insulinase family protein [Idiomarina seosinensis]|uniref:insulinase family protein n=1 Tax=Idiomarina seosinensis TaxID=281739 RepID=UPI00384BE301
MTSSSTTDEVVSIIRSSRDKRDYRALTLANGLSVLLAHCPDSPKAGAALSVNAGHFHDPRHTQGLAHFLEHMLLLGNHDYPSPSAFSDFLNAYGGQQNAWTGTEYSNFYFDCQANSLAQALQYFAAMFHRPLFDPGMIAKERQSIESEFRLKQKDELRRLYQVHKATSNPEHPFSQFSVGNLNTLNDDQYGTLAAKLQHFFATHFVAEKLRLVIAGPQSLDQLEQLAKQSFSDIRPASQATESASASATTVTQPLYQQHQLGVFLQVRPVKPARRLIITLPLPPIDDDYRHKTTSFIAHLLGYEGPGSLFSQLRQQGWINNLSAGGGISGSNFKDFNINIQLTEQGEQALMSVAQWVFNYIRLIEQQGIEAWRYRERKISAELSFKYQEPAPVGELVSQLAINAHHYPVEDVIYADFRMDALNQQRAADLLSLMLPERARLTWISAAADTDQVTPIYDAPYSIRSLRALELKQLKQSAENFNATLPAPNPFLDEHLQPYPLTTPQSDSAVPKCLVNDHKQQLWHLQDAQFRVPKGHIYLNLQAPAVNSSALNFACARIWSELMIDALNEDLYDAEVAGLHFNIYPTQAGITLHTTGLSAGQLPLLSYLMKQAWTVRFERQRWQATSQQMLHNWRSAHQSQPLNLLFSELNLALQQGLFGLHEMADACSELRQTQFTQIVAGLFEQLRVTALMHGDWQQQHAQQLAELIADNVDDQQALRTTPPDRIKRLGAGTDQLSQKAHSHPDAAVIQYYQGPSDTTRDQVAMMLLQQLIHQFVFDELRTRRQVGYMAGSQYFALQRIPGVILFVQSPTLNEAQLHEQLQQVMVLAVEQLEALTVKAWTHSKSLMRSQLQVKDRNLRVRSQRLWGAIQLGDTQFNRAQQLTSALDHWQLDEWLTYVNRLVIEQPALMRLQTAVNKV